ncbi:hypothetical protein [Streptomyces flaveus]|uniref:Uncharacterized protein n=1 Tax=Streptomyces flaveus TaxID=66370 RepID=A0A917V7M2_9ACTN|nr:hypothetical protein [Streptomyces flaveus]GGK46977.1 hypothetical protein GCM10010094_03690 [Streptomyces flaveus]
MLNSKKIAVTAGVLWSLALIGAGSTQAFGHDGSGKCADDGKGNARCVHKIEYTFTDDKRESVHIVNENTCKGGEDEKGSSRMACFGTATINGEPV